LSFPYPSLVVEEEEADPLDIVVVEKVAAQMDIGVVVDPWVMVLLDIAVVEGDYQAEAAFVAWADDLERWDH
jgi:hypothetical protein